MIHNAAECEIFNSYSHQLHLHNELRFLCFCGWVTYCSQCSKTASFPKIQSFWWYCMFWPFGNNLFNWTEFRKTPLNFNTCPLGFHCMILIMVFLFKKDEQKGLSTIDFSSNILMHRSQEKDELNECLVNLVPSQDWFKAQVVVVQILVLFVLLNQTIRGINVTFGTFYLYRFTSICWSYIIQPFSQQKIKCPEYVCVKCHWTKLYILFRTTSHCPTFRIFWLLPCLSFVNLLQGNIDTISVLKIQGETWLSHQKRYWHNNYISMI